MLRLVLPRLPAGLPGWAAGTARRLHAATRTCAPPPPPARPLVVQKYGGTSLGTSSKLEKVLDIVGKQHRDANVVAVVSALSAETKAEGSTSRLLAAADAAVGGGVFQHYLEAIEDTHLDVIFDMVKNAELREELREFVMAELKMVSRFCESLSVIQDLSPRSHDMIIGCGERLSAGLISGVLREHGLPAVYVNLSTLFPTGLDPSKPGYHEVAKKAISNRIMPLLSDSNQIPVVTGYLGHITGGIVNAIGRGYSDLTAALTATALNASELQILKESDGIFTGNPTKLDNARLVHVVTPREAAELTHFGNEVLHPMTSAALQDNVPVRVLNTFQPDSPGTLVDPKAMHGDLDRSRTRGIVAVVSKKNIPVISLSSSRNVSTPEYLTSVFDLLKKHNVKVDLISATVVNISMTVHESVPSKNIFALCEELSSLGNCNLETDRAIVSVIGEGMAHQVGLAGEFFTALGQGGVNIEMISQGSSELCMACVIRNDDVDAAVKLVHAHFLE